MNAFDFDQLHVIPSVQQFLSSIQEDLWMGSNVIVLLPPGILPDDLWTKIVDFLLLKEEVEFEVLSLEAHTGKSNPVSVLKEEFSLDWESQRANHTIDNLSRAANLPGVIYLKGFQKLERSDQEPWIGFLKQWGQKCQQLANPGHSNSVFCVIEPAAKFPFDSLESDLRLKYFWWWGFPSVLETQLLCRTANDVYAWGAEAQWREQILPALSTSDFSLLSIFWDEIHKSPEEITDKLRAYADELDWDDLDQFFNQGNRFENNALEELRSYPPVRLRNLWARGIICANKEFGIEIHPAALVKLGRKSELNHRLWRGQAQLLLPIIDNLRLDICKLLTDKLGDDWPLKSCEPDSWQELEAIKKNPLAVEWGYLNHLINHDRFLRPYQRSLSSMISLGRRLRNEIAHYQTVKLEDYESLLKQIQKFKWSLDNL
jgi:hypothetical protein